MRPFQTETGDYHSSLALDASTVGETTVTVGVMATRRQELDVLDSVYRFSDGDFKPFYDKANKLTTDSDSRFIAALIEEHRDSLTAYAHTHTSTVRDEQAEAVHGSIITHETYASGGEPMVLVDGGREKATHLTKAYSGLRSAIPPIAHCTKAELYYPTSLLADLTANYLANLIEQGDYNYKSPILRVPFAKRQRNDRWGQAYSAFYNNDIDYQPIGLPAFHGETVRERIRCWFDGSMATGTSDPPETDSITPVCNFMEEEGYDELASQFSSV